MGHCATVIAANALRLVDRLADFDFAAASTQALSVRTTRLHPYAYFDIGRHHDKSPLATNAPLGFAHSADLDVVPDTFGVHRIPKPRS